MISLIAALALGAAQAAAPADAAPGAQAFAALAVAQPQSVVVDCAVGAAFLTDCKIIGEAGDAAEEALELAVQIPAETARPVAIDGRITIKLMVNP